MWLTNSRLSNVYKHLHITVEKAMKVLPDNTCVCWEGGSRYHADPRAETAWNYILGALLDKEDLESDWYKHVNYLHVVGVAYETNILYKRFILITE